jgi:putative tricarboxylic transport membrane protein
MDRLKGLDMKRRINRDTITALLLLVLCGVLFHQTFNIRKVPFSEMGSEVWPRFVLLLMAVLAVIYLFQSMTTPAPQRAPFSFKAWLGAYRNPLICFGMFFVFLLALPWLGMLVAGVLFVFVTQTILGGAGHRRWIVHALVALVSVGGMWLLFTYALGVVLPRGELFS